MTCSRSRRPPLSPPSAATARPAATAPGRCAPPGPGPDLTITLESLSTDPCDHRHQARGHDPGVRLRHLAQVRHATCTSPVCRRPAGQCDFEHNTPYEAGGRTCLCNTGPKCRHDHRLKQHPRWHVDQLPDGTARHTAGTGRRVAGRLHQCARTTGSEVVASDRVGLPGAGAGQASGLRVSADDPSRTP